MGLILLIDFGFRRGTAGAEPLRPDPLERHHQPITGAHFAIEAGAVAGIRLEI